MVKKTLNEERRAKTREQVFVARNRPLDGFAGLRPDASHGPARETKARSTSNGPEEERPAGQKTSAAFCAPNVIVVTVVVVEGSGRWYQDTATSKIMTNSLAGPFDKAICQVRGQPDQHRTDHNDDIGR
jgi:hypothetical protein